MLILIFLDISTYKMTSEVFSNDGVLVRDVGGGGGGGGIFIVVLFLPMEWGTTTVYDHIIRAT